MNKKEPLRPVTATGLKHKFEFEGFHDVTRRFKDKKSGKVYEKTMQKRGPTSLNMRNENFDRISLGYEGRGTKNSDGGDDPSYYDVKDALTMKSEAKGYMHLFADKRTVPLKRRGEDEMEVEEINSK